MPIGTTAAIVGASVIGAGASMAGASKAAKAQTKAADQASATELHMFEQNREDLAPWREAGGASLKQLMAGLGDGSLTGEPDASQFRTDPGYQFAFDQGRQAVDRSAAARGTLNSGGTLKALTRYGQGMADQQYGQWYDRKRAVQGDKFNRLAAIAGVGQAATTQTAQMGAQVAGNIANNQLQAGNARASGYAAGAQGVNQAIGGAANAISLNNILKSGAGLGGMTIPQLPTWALS